MVILYRMVLGNAKSKTPVAYQSLVKQAQPQQQIPQQLQQHGGAPVRFPKQQPPQPQPPKPTVRVENMTMAKLISKYKEEDDEEEDMLPGFKYLKIMKPKLKSERVKTALKKHSIIV